MEMKSRMENGTYSVAMQGKFTFNDNQAFRIILEKFRDPAVRQVVLHLNQLEFIDSSGLGMLLLAHDQSVRHIKPLHVQGATGQVLRTLELAQMEELFKMA